MPKYVINAGQDSEQVVNAADYKDNKDLLWFYTPQGLPFMSYKKEFVETFDEQ